MLMPLKMKKSAGVPVTRAVHRLLRRGNLARDGRDWEGAATAYRTALDADPALDHIWIQLGHMLKEANNTDEAVEAYRMALVLRPDNPEPFAHIAHLHRLRGDEVSAIRYFIQAILTGDGDPASLLELQTIIAKVRMIDITSLRRAVQQLTADSSGASPSDPIAAMQAIDLVLSAGNIIESDTATLQSAREVLVELSKQALPTIGDVPNGIIFDVTDLVTHFRHHRLPTGIQRVQIEVVTRALRGAGNVRVCCFLDGRDDLLEVPSFLLAQIAEASTTGESHGSPDWATLIARLLIHLLTADPFAFRPGDTLVNLGTSWQIYNYFLMVRNAKRDYGIRYIPFVHDLIPIMAADHCVSGVIEDYTAWLVGVFDHADHFLVNSRSTGRDLMLAADRLGHALDEASIEVVSLDADFRQPMGIHLTAEQLNRWNLEMSSYCLIVSTIESRKNHVLALDAWAQLIEMYGPDHVPTLACVGRRGWLNGAFFERLDKNPALRAKVKLIEHVSDEELALLYQCCRFTIYPSHYEGWGLPVTESLCYGRVPLVADNSSLREAGGPFAVFFESNSLSDLVIAVEKMLFEVGTAEDLEKKIAAQFAPRSWASIAAQIVSVVRRVGQSAAAPKIPEIVAGSYYPVSLYKGTRIWSGLGSGEIFRIGMGWLRPGTDQCRTKAGGGALQMYVPWSEGPLRLYLRLRGLSSKNSAFVVSTGDETIATGILSAGEERWVLGKISAGSYCSFRAIIVKGIDTEEIEIGTGGMLDRLQASVGVVGFALVEYANEPARLKFIENVALEGLESANAYAEKSVSTSFRTVDSRSQAN